MEEFPSQRGGAGGDFPSLKGGARGGGPFVLGERTTLCTLFLIQRDGSKTSRETIAYAKTLRKQGNPAESFFCRRTLCRRKPLCIKKKLTGEHTMITVRTMCKNERTYQLIN